MAQQASAERSWASLSRLYENVKKGVKGRKVGIGSISRGRSYSSCQDKPKG